MISNVYYALLGLGVGAFSGLVGLGGGVIMIPALVLLFGFTQQRAQGTTLAMMIPPIGLFAALQYYREGAVDIRVAAFAALGFLIGGFFGAKIATSMSTVMLQRVFGVAVIALGARMLFAK